MTDVAESTAGAIVETRISELMAYGNDAVDRVNLFQSSMLSLLQELEPPDVSSLGEIAVPTSTPLEYDRPDIGTVIFQDPAQNNLADPSYEEIPTVDTNGIVNAMADVGNLTSEYEPPDKPTLNYNGTSTPQAPTIVTVPMPTAPDIEYPDAPVFTELDYPSAPTQDTVVFDSTKPTLEAERNLPSSFSFDESNYVSSVWETVIEKINTDLASGGVGVSAEVRDGLYQEMVDKQRDEHERQYREAQARYGSAGFSLPTGAFVSALSEISLENSRQEEGFRRNIYLNQMTLAQQNTQWALDKGVQIEQILRDFFSRSEDRRLEVSKAIAQRGTEIFNAYVTKFNAQTELYKTDAAIYESKLRGESEKINAYKTAMEGKKIEADVQKTAADIYAASMGALEIKARIFSIQNDTAKIQSEIEGLKIEQYKASLQAYIAGLESDKNVVALYSAGLESERIKAEINAQKISAQTQKISAWKIVVDAQIANAELKVRQNSQKVEQYKAELETYNSELNYNKAYNDSKTAMFSQASTAYNSRVEAVKSENMLKIEEMKTRLQEASLNVQKLTEELKLIVQGYVSVNQMKIQGAESLVNVNAQLAASALGAANVNASYGQSTNSSYDHNDPVHRSISESHSYTY